MYCWLQKKLSARWSNQAGKNYPDSWSVNLNDAWPVMKLLPHPDKYEAAILYLPEGLHQFCLICEPQQDWSTSTSQPSFSVNKGEAKCLTWMWQSYINSMTQMLPVILEVWWILLLTQGEGVVTYTQHKCHVGSTAQAAWFNVIG